jgi:outer membrane receptor protein involved in Fe transport
VGIDWNLNPTTLIYANVSRGFKGGSFPVINSSAQTQNVPATQEKLVAYEAGFKSGLFDRRLQVNGAAFYYDYTDKQITGAILDPVSGPLQKVVNLPKSRVLGAELQVNWAPIDHLKIASSGTYISTKIRGCPTVNATSVQPGCQTGGYYSYDSFGVLVPLTGDSFPNVSKWSGSIDAEYSYPISSSAQIMVGGLLSYQSSKMAQLGTNSALGAANPDRIFEIPSYALLDLRIGIEDRDGRWRAELFGRNVTNKYYRTGIQRANDTITAWTGMPATYGVTVSFRN